MVSIQANHHHKIQKNCHPTYQSILYDIGSQISLLIKNVIFLVKILSVTLEVMSVSQLGYFRAVSVSKLEKKSCLNLFQCEQICHAISELVILTVNIVRYFQWKIVVAFNSVTCKTKLECRKWQPWPEPFIIRLTYVLFQIPNCDLNRHIFFHFLFSDKT